MAFTHGGLDAAVCMNEIPAGIRDAFGRIRGVTPSTVKHFGDFCNASPGRRRAR